jgi:PAS domain-containing protein
MTNKAVAVDQLANLRIRAASRLTGAAGAKGAPFNASDALAVLHDLASSPDTASDALTLLHELQVYQVELDLQTEELQEARSELESALRRQIELYDFQPVGCFTIDRSLVVHELNLSGAKMLGIARDEAHGLLLDTVLSPNSSRTMRELISSIVEGKACVSPTLQLTPKDGMARVVRAHIGADPAGQRFLLVLADAGEDHGTQGARR